MPEYRVETCLIHRPDEIERDWLDLQGRVDCSFFQSWGWIGTWLQQLALDIHPVVLRVWDQNTLIAIGVFVGKQLRRHIFVRSSALFLNECPFDGRNMVIEYNGLLCGAECRDAVYQAAFEHLLGQYPRCEEIYFGATGDDSFSIAERYLSVSSNVKVEPKLLDESMTWSIDLGDIGESLDTFVSGLSKNRRAQIRRSLRVYGQSGPLQLIEAGDANEALEYFDGLKDLHTARWWRQGRSGSFANPLWERFHRGLIRSRFDHGEIQLLSVSNTSGVIGYLYNLVWRKRVYVLQTGLKITDDKRLMPGYVVHAMAIAYNKHRGMTIYDLMHGDSLYKRILCNRNERLRWYVLQRKRPKFILEDYARRLKQILHGQVD